MTRTAHADQRDRQYTVDREPFLEVLSRDVQFSASELNDMKDTNIEVIPAPGTGWAVVPVGIHMWLDYGGAAFVQGAATDQFAMKYIASNEIVEIGLAASFEAFIEATSDEAFFVWFGEPVSLGGMTLEANKAVVMDNNGATDLTTGSGTMSCRIFYMILPMAEFA